MKNPLESFYVTEQGSKLFYNVPFTVKTEARIRTYKQNEILVAYLIGSMINPPVESLFERADIDMLLEMGAKKPRKLSTELFMGRVGERILQARVDDYLRRLKKRFPNLEYVKLEGEPKTIIGVGEKYIAVIEGHHNNVVILTPQEDLAMPLTKRHIGKPIKREVRRILDSAGELDGFYSLEYPTSNHALVLCEAKTGALDKKPEDIIKYHISPLKQMHQKTNPEIIYCLMATKEVLLGSETGKELGDKVKNLYESLQKKGIPLIIIPFNETKFELEKIGEKLYKQYTKIRGPANLNLGTALYNDNKIIVKDSYGRIVSNLDKTKSKTWKQGFSKKE